MELLIISVLCSVSVGILFKMNKLSLQELISVLLFGYITCFLLSLLLFDVNIDLETLNVNKVLIITILSFLMPSVFIALKFSIEKNGIAKTDLVQRMSLIIPLISSFIIFGESISNNKVIALIIGFLSILLIMHRNENKFHKKNIFYLIYIFFGYGMVDILFKSITSMPFKSLLVFVFIGCIINTLFYIIFKRIKIFTKGIFIGLCLGMLNFFNIFTYLQAHQKLADSPTIVFTTMNLGVIGLGLVIGTLFFNEKISKWNILGLIFATFAILLMKFNIF